MCKNKTALEICNIVGAFSDNYSHGYVDVMAKADGDLLELTIQDGYQHPWFYQEYDCFGKDTIDILEKIDHDLDEFEIGDELEAIYRSHIKGKPDNSSIFYTAIYITENIEKLRGYIGNWKYIKESSLEGRKCYV